MLENIRFLEGFWHPGGGGPMALGRKGTRPAPVGILTFSSKMSISCESGANLTKLE